MKGIDWKEVFSHKDHSANYTCAIKNRFDLLSLPEDDIESTYINITKAVEEVALELIHKLSSNY